MSVERLQANLPLTDKEGRLTPIAVEVFAKWASKLDELEARIVVLEP